jgi:hypothetical protein
VKPLQAIGLGFVFLVLVTTVGGYDLYPDWFGWGLVLVGVRALPRDYPLRSALLYVGLVALAVAVPLWVPAVDDALADADESIAWALNLPRFGFAVLLALALARAAEAADARGPATWWRVLMVGNAVVAVLPVLVFGGGLEGLGVIAGTLVVVVPLTMTVALFWHSGRAWAGAPERPEEQVRQE